MKLNQTICTVFITLLVLSVASTAHAGKGNGKNKGGGGSGEEDTGGLTPVTITFENALNDRVGSDNYTPYMDGDEGVEAFLATKANFGNVWLRLDKSPSRGLYLDFTDCATPPSCTPLFATGLIGLSAIKVDANDVQADGLFGMAIRSTIYPPMRIYYQDNAEQSLEEEQAPGFIYFNSNIKGKSPCKNLSDNVEVYRENATLWTITGIGFPNTACATLPGGQQAGRNLAGVFYMPFEFTVEIN